MNDTCMRFFLIVFKFTYYFMPLLLLNYYENIKKFINN